jgi:Icc-related predicted phosphoesterase
VIPSAADGSWAVQILADIQDGFHYLPELLTDGARLGARAVVIAGDLQRGDGGRHLGLVVRELRQHGTSAPIFVVPGNHDAMTQADRDAFEAAFGASVFEFRIGSTWFEGLDSTNPASFEAERRRLRARIGQAARAGESVVVVRHHSPLRDVGGLADDALLEVLRDPSVAFVIAGHGHTSRVDRVGSTRFVVAPPSGDRSHGQGQTSVSYLMLRARGGRLSLELHQFSRRNGVDARCAWTHAWLVHILPFLRGWQEQRPRAASALTDAP